MWKSDLHFHSIQKPTHMLNTIFTWLHGMSIFEITYIHPLHAHTLLTLFFYYIRWRYTYVYCICSVFDFEYMYGRVYGVLWWYSMCGENKPHTKTKYPRATHDPLNHLSSISRLKILAHISHICTSIRIYVYETTTFFSLYFTLIDMFVHRMTAGIRSVLFSISYMYNIIVYIYVCYMIVECVV